MLFCIITSGCLGSGRFACWFAQFLSNYCGIFENPCKILHKSHFLSAIWKFPSESQRFILVATPTCQAWSLRWVWASGTCRQCSRSSTTGLENTSFRSGSWLQRLCGHFNHQATETRGSLRTNTAASNQVPVRDCWAKQQLPVDQVRGPHLSCKTNTTLRGGQSVW